MEELEVLILVGFLAFLIPIVACANKGLISSQFLFHSYLFCGICIPYSLVSLDVIPPSGMIFDLKDPLAANAYV